MGMMRHCNTPGHSQHNKLMCTDGMTSVQWYSWIVRVAMHHLSAFPPPPSCPTCLSGGAPELLSVLLEGESLFNDASSIVLFEVFLKTSLEGPASGGGGGSPDADVLALLPGLMKHVGYLMISGALAGLMMGVVTRWGARRAGFRVGFWA